MILQKQAGHKVNDLMPSLCPVVTEEKEPSEMMGLSLKNCTLSLYERGKRKSLFFVKWVKCFLLTLDYRVL